MVGHPMPSDEMLMYLAIEYLLVAPGSVPKLGHGVVYDLRGAWRRKDVRCQVTRRYRSSREYYI